MKINTKAVIASAIAVTTAITITACGDADNSSNEISEGLYTSSSTSDSNLVPLENQIIEYRGKLKIIDSPDQIDPELGQLLDVPILNVVAAREQFGQSGFEKFKFPMAVVMSDPSEFDPNNILLGKEFGIRIDEWGTGDSTELYEYTDGTKNELGLIRGDSITRQYIAFDNDAEGLRDLDDSTVVVKTDTNNMGVITAQMYDGASVYFDEFSSVDIEPQE